MHFLTKIVCYNFFVGPNNNNPVYVLIDMKLLCHIFMLLKKEPIFMLDTHMNYLVS